MSFKAKQSYFSAFWFLYAVENSCLVNYVLYPQDLVTEILFRFKMCVGYVDFFFFHVLN